MSAPESFDAVIIGAGQAGPPLAARLSAAGQSVCLVERKFMGGTCVNTGCMPTKTLVASAYAAQLARRAAQYGVEFGGRRARRYAQGLRACRNRHVERTPWHRNVAAADAALHGGARPGAI